MTVAVSSGDTAAATVSPSPLTFTTSTWDTRQTVTVTGVADADAADETLTVTATASGADYQGQTAEVDVTVTDDESAGLVLSQTQLTIDEDGAGTFTVKLASQPTGTVTLAVSSGDTSAATVPSPPLTFTTSTWDTAQTVTVTGVADADAADETLTVTATASGADYAGQTDDVAVTVTDTETAGLVVDPATLTVNEDGTGTFTVTLAAVPTVPVSVTFTSSDPGAATVPATALTFTATSWDTPQTVTVTGAQDGDNTDESLTVTATAAGGEYAGATAEVTVSVTDDDNPALVVDPTSLTVDEGGARAFTMRLATAPTATVTVTLTLGGDDPDAVMLSLSELTFTADDWDTAQDVGVGGVEDDDRAHETVTVTATAAGGDYEGKTAVVTVTVDDDEALELWARPATQTIEENGTGTIAVRLGTMPTGIVSVSLFSGDPGALSLPGRTLFFQQDEWDIEQTTTATGVDDRDLRDESVTVNIRATQGGYAGITTTVTVNVEDDDTPSVVMTPQSHSLDEGGTAMVMVRLRTQPTGPVTVALSSDDTGAVTVSDTSLSFTSSDYDTLQTVTVTAVEDDDGVNETGTLTGTASGANYEGLTNQVSVTVTDDETAELIVSSNMLAFYEGNTSTFTVVLATEPTETVTVTLESDDSGAATVDLASLSFTASNWDTPVTVTVTGEEDTDVFDETAAVTVVAAGGDYAGMRQVVAIEVTDDEAVDVVVAPESLTVAEEMTGAFTVKLADQPTTTVTVTLGSDDTGAVSVPATALTFTTGNWGTTQTVTVSALADDDATDETVVVTATSSEARAADVTVTVEDDDTPAIVLDPASLTIDEGGTGTFTVTLATEPSQLATVVLSSSNVAASLSRTSLEFVAANWNVPQVVTLTGVEDTDTADHALTVTATAAGGDYEGETGTVSVTVTDDDTAGFVLNRTAQTIVEDGTGTFTVKLATQPTQTVTVTTSSADTGGLTVAPATRTFTRSNWDNPQTQTVTGVADADALNEYVVVTVSASGGDYAAVSSEVEVFVTDDDEENLVATPVKVTVAEGESATFTLELGAQPADQVVVRVQSLDTDAAAASPPLLLFTSVDWDTPQTVTVEGVADLDDDDELVLVTATAGGGSYTGASANVAVEVQDGDTNEIVLSTNEMLVGEGHSLPLDVRLGSLPSETVTVMLTSGDTGAVALSPSSLTFTVENWDTDREVTVNPKQDGDIRNEEVTVTATASGGVYDGVTEELTVTVRDDETTVFAVHRGDPTFRPRGINHVPLGITEGGHGSLYVRLSGWPQGRVTVTVTSSDPGAATVSPSTLTFWAGNNPWHRVIVTALDDADISDEEVTVTVVASGADISGETMDVPIRVADDDTPAVLFPVSPFILYDGQWWGDDFPVRLSQEPSGPVIVVLTLEGASGKARISPAALTFTPDNWDTRQAVTAYATREDDDGISEVVSVIATAYGGEYEGIQGTYQIVRYDSSVHWVYIDGPREVDEGTSTRYLAGLGFRPAAPVTMIFSNTNRRHATVSRTYRTVQPEDFETGGTVRLFAREDNDHSNDLARLKVTVISDGFDFNGLSYDRQVAIDDNDTFHLELSADHLSVREDGSATLTIRPLTEPTGPVTVTFTAAESGVITFMPSTLMFDETNYETAQILTVSGVLDDDEYSHFFKMNVSAAGGGYTVHSREQVQVYVFDPDYPHIITSPSSFKIAEGESTTYTLRLSEEPEAPVSVGLYDHSRGAVTVTPRTLSFSDTDWDTPKTVTVTGVHGKANQGYYGSSWFQLIYVASGGQFEDERGGIVGKVVEAANSRSELRQPSEGKGTVVVEPATQPTVTVAEGARGTFSVRLTAQPAGTVRVALRSSDPGAATVSPAALTFTPSNWRTAQTVAVDAVEDDDATDEQVDVTATASGADYGDKAAVATVVVTDDDRPNLVLNQSQMALEEGGAGTFTVRLATAPTGTVTVTVGSDDAAAATALPANLIFTTTNWDTAQTVRVTGVASEGAPVRNAAVTVAPSGADYAGVATATVTVAVVDAGWSPPPTTSAGGSARQDLTASNRSTPEQAPPQ